MIFIKVSKNVMLLKEWIAASRKIRAPRNDNFFIHILFHLPSRLVGIFISGAFLSGCVGIGGNFDCNMDSGGRCAPMHQINRMASRGSFSSSEVATDKPYEVDKSRFALRKEIRTKQNILGATQSSSNPLRSNLLRSDEKTQQIWIGPYEDANGNYHEGSNVYTVVKKSEWLSV